MALDYRITHQFWENRGLAPGLDALNVTMLRDRLPELAWFIDRAERAHLRRVLTIHKEMTVLDLGCGNGRLALDFAARCRAVVAVDFSQALLDLGQAAARAAGAENIRWVRASALDFDSAEPFDAIFLGSLLQYLNDADVAGLLPRLRGMLKPGGTLASRDSVLADGETQPPATPHGRVAIYRTAADYAAFFADAGLAAAYASDLYAFPAAAYAWDRLAPRRLRTGRLPRAALMAALRLQLAVDPLLLRMPKVNRLLAGRRAKIVQRITLCRRAEP